MADEIPPSEWLTYRAAGERMGVGPAAVAARARRGRWPKRTRNDTGEAEILVPGELLAKGPQEPRKREPPTDAPSVTEAVQAAVAPLQAMVDVLLTDLKVARAEAATAQADAAELRGAAAANTARIEDLKAAAERDTERAERDRQALQLQADDVRHKLSAAQAEAGKAATQAREDRRKLEDVEDRLAKTRRELQDEQAKPKRRRWWPF